MDKLLSGLSDAPNIEFPQFLVLIVIVLISGAFKNVFMCMFNCIAVAIKYTFKAIAVALEFLYAVLVLIFNFILHLKDKISLTPFAVHWSSDSSQEADRKTTSKLFENRKASPESKQTDVAMKDST